MIGKLETVGPAKSKGKRLALLICNGTFPNIEGMHLVGPAKDAETLGRVLTDPEAGRFKTRTVVDRGLREVRLEVARICADAGPGDTLLIYYSGNGLQDSDGGFHLLVADSDNTHLEATALDADFILARLRASACRNIVLLIDTCHSGAFFDQNRGVPNGLFAISSCGADELCADTPHGGAFTLALAAGLRHAQADREGDSDGLVSVAELHEFVKRRLAASDYPGTPQKWEWNVPEPIYLASAPRYVFLSYSREDSANVDKIAAALDARDFAMWIDREAILSGSWKERVTEGLNKARALVLLLTEHSLASEPVRKELAFAAAKDVPIIPVQWADFDERLLPDWFILDYSELHRHTLDEASFDAGMDALAAAIRRARGAGPAPRLASGIAGPSKWSTKSPELPDPDGSPANVR